MPITQDRMLALINAARDYQKALNSCLATIKSAWENVTEYGMDAKDQLERVHNLAVPNAMILERSDSAAVIMVEEKWFRRFGRINERNKKKAQLRRGRDPLANPAAADEDNDLAVRNLENLVDAGIMSREKYNRLVVNGRYIGAAMQDDLPEMPPISDEQAAEDRLKRLRESDDADDDARRAAMWEEYERIKWKQSVAQPEANPPCDDLSHPAAQDSDCA